MKPTEYVDLATAHQADANTVLSFIGMVADVMPPRKALSGQVMFTFKLLDQSLHESAYGTSGLSVRFFRPNESTFPKVQARGDIVLLRNIKMTIYAGQPVALGSFTTSHLTFSQAAIPDPAYSIAFRGEKRLQCRGSAQDVGSLTAKEQELIINLKASMKSVLEEYEQMQAVNVRPAAEQVTAPVTVARPAPRNPHSTFGPKFQLVSQLQHRVFADVCVQIAKLFPNKYDGCELYVTDYTENKSLWYYATPEEKAKDGRDGDTYGFSTFKREWPGPYGFRVLKVNVKPPHSNFAQSSLVEGDTVLLRNVKMKYKDETKLEGDMWPDDLNSDKIMITKQVRKDVPEIEQLLIRKEKYWTNHPNYKPPEDPEVVQANKEKKKDKKRKKRERATKNASERATEQSEPDKQSSTEMGNASGMNQHVRCLNEEVPISTFHDILDTDNTRHTNHLPDGRHYILPFINAKYRAQVKVVDYEPKDLQDFAGPPTGHLYDSQDSPIDYDRPSPPRWVWSFSLQLEDASPKAIKSGKLQRMWVTVRHEDAQYLFNKLEDPWDLRRSPRVVAGLREKLCIMWGNLEEREADQPLSNRPFECCIGEYGIELDAKDPEKDKVPMGWKKMFRLFGTTIP